MIPRRASVLLLAPALAAGALASDSLRAIEARYTAEAPRIDGILESLWDSAPAAAGFVQRTPVCGAPAGEATTAYLLYDDGSLYVAFRCEVADPGMVASSLSGANDAVQLFLDTFDDDATAYTFSVRASGTENDYRVTEDGGWYETWDGVWRSAVRVHPWGYAVELAIPFKTLRYPADSDRWGVDFGRSSVHLNERSYWSRHEQAQFRVARMGELRGIRPRVRGLHLELYPVGLARAEQDVRVDFGRDTIARIAPDVGLDLSWYPVPATNMQLTTFPDYAQIEADPYRVNLSRYEQWLTESRPFFVEAAETFGTGYQPLSLFYSRRVGRPLPDGEAVPIWSGAKLTSRIGRYSVGLLGALTGRVDYDNGGVPATEPTSFYSVLSLREQSSDEVDWGLLYAGKDNEGFSNHAVGLDAGLRINEFSARLFVARSQQGDALGSGFAGNLYYRGERFRVSATLARIDSSFDVNGVGYTGWRGDNVNVGIGPAFYNLGPVQDGQVQAFAELGRSWDETEFSRRGGLSGHFSFRNRSSAGLWAWAKREWERDSLYWSSSVGGEMSTDYARPFQLQLHSEFTGRAYNYRRGLFAPNAGAELLLSARLGDYVLAELELRPVFEFGPAYELEPAKDATLVLAPGVVVTFAPKMDLRLGAELVRGYDPVSDQRYDYYYAALLYSWVFRPKSRIYVALNQRLDTGGEDGRLRLLERIAVVKLRYLFVF